MESQCSGNKTVDLCARKRLHKDKQTYEKQTKTRKKQINGQVNKETQTKRQLEKKVDGYIICQADMKDRREHRQKDRQHKWTGT